MEVGGSQRLQFHLDAPHSVRIHPTEVPCSTMAIGLWRLNMPCPKPRGKWSFMVTPHLEETRQGNEIKHWPRHQVRSTPKWCRNNQSGVSFFLVSLNRRLWNLEKLIVPTRDLSFALRLFPERVARRLMAINHSWPRESLRARLDIPWNS